MSDIQSEIKQLNDEIVAAHDKHYAESPTGLWKPDESPNGNSMYHLYNDGEITYEKGGWAYGKRSVFQFSMPINKINKIKFEFPKKHVHNVNESYVMLTENECIEFRNKMISMLKKYEGLL
jgi:hypothetical protein